MALENVLEVPSYSSACPVLWKLFLLHWKSCCPHNCPVFSGQAASLCLHGRLRKGEHLLEASQGPQKRHISEINLGQELCDLFFPVLFSCAVIPAAPAHAQLCFLPTDAPTLTSISLLLCLIHLVMYKYICCLYFQALNPFVHLLFVFCQFFCCSEVSQYILHLSWALGAHA